MAKQPTKRDHVAEVLAKVPAERPKEPQASDPAVLAAERLMAKLSNPYHVWPNEHTPAEDAVPAIYWPKSWLVDALRQARAEGFRLGQERMRGRAAKATCPGCADEDYFPAESDPTRGMVHWSKDSYIGGGGRDYVRCRASLIAALPIEEEPQP